MVEPSAPQISKVNVNKFMEKVRSKKELYTFLTHDGQAYLPKIESTNVYFFRQIVSGKKEVRLWLTPLINFPVH